MKSRYRSVMVFSLMMVGSFLTITTISALLDRSMLSKTPAVAEVYVPPSSPPVIRTQSTTARSMLMKRADRS